MINKGIKTFTYWGTTNKRYHLAVGYCASISQLLVLYLKFTEPYIFIQV